MPQGPNAPYTALDQNQILQRSFEESADRLRVDAEVTAVLGTVECVISAASGDNIAITNQDGTNPLEINNDGSINVNVISSVTSVDNNFIAFNRLLALVAGVETTITTFTASPITTEYALVRVNFSGTQIATYTVYLNNVPISVYRTYFSGGLSGDIEYFSPTLVGLNLSNNDIIKITVIFNRPGTGDFEAALQIFSTIP